MVVRENRNKTINHAFLLHRIEITGIKVQTMMSAGDHLIWSQLDSGFKLELNLHNFVSFGILLNLNLPIKWHDNTFQVGHTDGMI